MDDMTALNDYDMNPITNDDKSEEGQHAIIDEIRDDKYDFRSRNAVVESIPVASGEDDADAWSEEGFQLSSIRSKVYNEKMFLKLNEELFLGGIIQRGKRPEATPGEKRRCENASDILSTANLKLVYKIALGIYKQYPLGTTKEDCIASGMVGMARAINSYDPSKGFKFSTYATMWIKHYVQRMGHSIARPAGLPASKIEAITSVNKRINEIKGDGGEITPSIMDDLLRDHNMTQADWHKANSFNTQPEYLGTPTYDDDSDSIADRMNMMESRVNTLGEWALMDSETIANRDHMNAAIRKTVAALPDRQKELINLIYFADQPMGKTGEMHRSIAQARRELGLTKNEADKELKQAKKTLRATLSSYGYNGIID